MRVWFALTFTALVACSKSSDSPAPAASLVQTAQAPSAAPVSPSEPTAPPTNDWTGHYTASLGTISVPDGGEWAGVKFRGDDGGVAVGDGTLSISVDPNGHIRGELEGPLGTLQITGALADNALGASLRSSDPGRGFSGTAVGTQAGNKIAGTMRLSLPTGNVVREASFTLDRNESPRIGERKH